MGETITLTSSDGTNFSAYRARPTGQVKGGIVVVQEIFGVNHHIRSVADRYAAEGYLAIAPALFDRIEPGIELGYDQASMGTAFGLFGKIDVDLAVADVAAAVAAASEAGKVGVVGYCFGGRLAYLASARIPGLAAAVGYYGGGILNYLGEAPKAPLLLHFGERDSHIPLSDVEKIQAAYPAIPVHIYAADHGFNCDERASFDAPSAKLALERTLAFFKEHVG